MPNAKKFWQFCNQVGNTVELLLYGDISQTSWWGDEVTPRQFAEELSGLGALDKIVVRINSGGGDVFAAQTIGNLLEQHPAEVTATIDGLCASAATVVACHCGKVIAANDSTYMVHPVKMGARGYYNAEELQKYIEALTVIRENVVSLYRYLNEKSVETYKKIANRGGNNNGIGMEVCINEGADIYLNYQRSAKLTAYLMDKFNLTIEDVKPHHYFSGKPCPATLKNNGLWDYFLQMVKIEYDVLQFIKEGYEIKFISNTNNILENGRIKDLAKEVKFKIVTTYNGIEEVYE